MMAIFISIAVWLLSTLDSIATLVSVKAKGLAPPSYFLFGITFCDTTASISVWLTTTGLPSDMGASFCLGSRRCHILCKINSFGCCISGNRLQRKKELKTACTLPAEPLFIKVGIIEPRLRWTDGQRKQVEWPDISQMNFQEVSLSLQGRGMRR
jgi:hypothetical protein